MEHDVFFYRKYTSLDQDQFTISSACHPSYFHRLAFVIQEDRVDALGGGGQDLGYGGINNSLAVEFDTYYNPGEIDPYENHVSVHTRGWRHPNSPNHTYSLGHTNRVPDLTDGEIRIR